jgi:glycerophosphoryl diester phosphodiesterase
VNRIHDMLKLEEMGVNSIITDYPTSTRIFFDNRADSLFRLPGASEDSMEDNNHMLPGATG